MTCERSIKNGSRVFGLGDREDGPTMVARVGGSGGEYADAWFWRY